MIKLLPFLLLMAYGVGLWFFSAWRLRQTLNAQSTPLRDARLAPLLARLGAAMDLPPVRAHIYEVEPINGLAAPDGRIFLTRGFLRQMDAGTVTPEELASVVAHELGHVSLGHSRRRMIDFAGQNAIRLFMVTTLGRFVPFIGPWLGTLVASAIAARLSRQDEFEADHFASALMVRAGLGTAPQKSLLAKLPRLTGVAGGPVWLASHPPAPQRIAAIEAHEARWQ